VLYLGSEVQLIAVEVDRDIGFGCLGGKNLDGDAEITPSP